MVAHPQDIIAISSLCEWVGAKLEMHSLARLAFAAFVVPGGVGAVVRPEPFAFPTGLRIVDPAVHPAVVEPDGIWHAHDDELPVGEGYQRIRIRAGGKGHVLAQPERVELIHPVVVEHVAVALVGHALEFRPWRHVQCPAFGTMLSRRGWAIQGSLALAPVEAGQMSAASQRGPDDAVPIDVDPPRGKSVDGRLRVIERGLVIFRQRGLRRGRGPNGPNDGPGGTAQIFLGEGECFPQRLPDPPIYRGDNDAVTS